MITEVYIEGFALDLTADISSLLTFAIDDVKDFASRQTTFSKEITVPGTGNNNAIFGNIFETGISNDYDFTQPNIGYNFNAAKSAKCIIFQDNLQTFKGTLRLLQINIDKGRPEYQVAMNGDLTTLNVVLSSGLLTDLDFSDYDRPWGAFYIQNSWDNEYAGKGVFFPLIDYGASSQGKHHWCYDTFKPSFFVKEYIDKIFAAAQFKYSCDLFNTKRFKGLVVPHNQKILTSRVSNVLAGTLTGSQSMLDTTRGQSGASVAWNKFTGGGFNQTNGVFTYTQTEGLTTNISWALTGTRFADVAGTFEILVRKNGVTIASSGPISVFPHTSFYSYHGEVTTTINTNDTLDFYFHYLTGTGVIVTIDNSSPGYSTFNVVSNTPTLQPVNYGQMITMNDCLPQNVRQIDFVSSIVKLFNLYVTEDPFDDRLIHISPFIDFYNPMVNKTIDWSYKLNRNAPISIKPMSELNTKIYNFKYKDDSDYYNDLYKKRYNQSYGSRIYDTEFEFTAETSTVELDFASTPLVGYLGEDKLYSTIFKRTGDIVGMGEEKVDSVIRILQTRKRFGLTTWKMLSVPNDTSQTVGTYNKYGYAGHIDAPDDPSNDLNFGATKELFFVFSLGNLNRNQFNVYWSDYMAEITNKDSKLLTGRFYLTPKDIFDLNFARFVVIDGVLFRLNKIVDYNASTPSDCEVQLLRVIKDSYTYVPFPPIFNDDYLLLSQKGEDVLDYNGTKINYHGNG